MPEMTKNGLRWTANEANISYVALFDKFRYFEFRYFGTLADPLMIWVIVFDSEVLKTETLK